MKTNQKIEGGFDLDAFVGKAAPAQPTAKESKADPPSKTQKPVEAKKRGGGRPPNPLEENLSERAQVRMTIQEMAKVKSQAGLAPISVYLRAEMKKVGIL